jgi:hypothetical protein
MASRPIKSRRKSQTSRELMAAAAANPSPVVRMKQPPQPQQLSQPKKPAKTRRKSLTQKIASVGNSVKNKWRRKSVMTRTVDRSFDKNGGSPPPPPPPGDGMDYDSSYADLSGAPPPVVPQHHGFVGSSLSVLDESETAPQTMRVFLMNNSYHEFDVDVTTLAAEICLELREIIQLHNDAACSLFSYTRGTYILIQDETPVLDIVRTWHPDDAETGASRLVYKARIYIPGGHLLTESAKATSAENGAHRLCYMDAVHRTITGLYSLPLESAPMLAALQLQSSIGDYDVNSHGATYISDVGIENYIAPALKSRFDTDEALEDMIRDQHKGLVGTSRFDAECRYMETINKHVDYYGSSFFAARVMRQATDSEDERTEPQAAIVAISFNGIYLLSGWNLSQQSYHSYEVITKWTVATNPDLFAFSVHDQLIYFLMCENPSAIEDCLQMHISTIISQRRGAPTASRRNESRILAAKKERFDSEVVTQSDTKERNFSISHDDLPKGWSEAVDESTGKTYFWHEETNKTSWVHPNSKPRPPSSKPPAPKATTPKTATKEKTGLSLSSKRRMNKRRKSALMNMASRRRASVNMVLEVSNRDEKSTTADQQKAVVVETNVKEEEVPAVAPKSSSPKPVPPAATTNEATVKNPTLQTRLTNDSQSKTVIVKEDVKEKGREVKEVQVIPPAPRTPEKNENVKVKVKEDVVLTWLRDNRLEKYFEQLKELGVDQIKDLQDVLEEDLETLGFKKLEIRRFLSASKQSKQ